MVNGRGSRADTKLEGAISYVLIIGVLASLLFMVAGMLLFYVVQGSAAISHGSNVFLRGENFFVFLGSLFSSRGLGWPVRLITLGIALLILTPYVRAMLSVAYFAATGNMKYFFITLFVFAILTVSLIVH